MVSIPLVSDVLAQPIVQEGPTYRNIFDSSTHVGTWTGYTIPRLQANNGTWMPYIISEDSNVIQVETGHGSVILHKDVCAFSFYSGRIDQSSQKIFSDSILVKRATNGTDAWSFVNSVNNAACQPSLSVSGSTITLAAKKQAAAGIVIYKYISKDGKWKTELDATNFSGLTDQKFGFTQTIDLNRDTVYFNGGTKNLQNFNNTTFDRAWLDSHSAQVIDFLNGYNFDFDLSFANLWAVTVYAYPDSTSKLVFDFANNAPVIAPSQTLIIDPTFGYTAGTMVSVQETNCVPAAAAQGGGGGFVGRDGTPNCLRIGAYWNITTISDSSRIQSVNARYDVLAGVVGGGAACKWMSIEGNLSSETNQQRYNDIGDGPTVFVAASSQCQTAGTDYLLNLGTNATADLQAELAVDNEWGLGIFAPSEDAGAAAYEQFDTTGMELQVTYIVPENVFLRMMKYDNSTAITAGQFIVQNSTGTLVGGSVNSTGWADLSVQNQNDNVNFTAKETTDNFVVFEEINKNVTADYTRQYNTNVFFVDCPSTGAGDDIEVKVNYTASHNSTYTTIPSCDASNNVTWVVSFANRGLSSANQTTTTIATILNSTFASNAGSFTVNGTSISTSFASSKITSSSFTVCGGSTTCILNFNMTLTALPTASASLDTGVVGDVTYLNATVNVMSGNPPPTITLLRFYDNGTLFDTENVSQSVPASASFTFSQNAAWRQMASAAAHNFTVAISLNNPDGSYVANSTGDIISREYPPSYFIALDPTQGDVNYTTSRSGDQDSVYLKANREKGGNTFNIECIAQTNAQARATSPSTANWAGTWINYSGTGWFNGTWTGNSGTHIYLTCFNDGELFTTTSFTNSSLAIFGIEIFDASYGQMLGVPVGIFFLVLAAGMGNKRTAPTWIIVIIAMAGILSTIGFFSLNPLVWGFALVTGLLGVMVNQKVF